MKKLIHITEMVIDSKLQHLKGYSHRIHKHSHLFDDLVNNTLIDTLFKDLNHSFTPPDFVVDHLHFLLIALNLLSFVIIHTIQTFIFPKHGFISRLTLLEWIKIRLRMRAPMFPKVRHDVTFLRQAGNSKNSTIFRWIIWRRPFLRWIWT